MKRKGVLFVISGFAGAGKGTLVRMLVEKYDNYAVSVSATTRKPREGEIEGVHYFYKTEEEFLEMIEKDMLYEYAKYVDHYYGTPKEYVQKQLEAGKDVILEIEIQGALKIKEQFPDTLLLFVTPPDADTLEARLRGRGTEPDDIVRKRLSRAVEESEAISQYDYIIVNDIAEEAAERIHAIIQSEHYAVQKNQEFIQNLRDGLDKFKL
ncbi:MAG: guanylate kinase [Muricoprocola sp.]